jgi:hypothetical protein
LLTEISSQRYVGHQTYKGLLKINSICPGQLSYACRIRTHSSVRGLLLVDGWPSGLQGLEGTTQCAPLPIFVEFRTMLDMWPPSRDTVMICDYTVNGYGQSQTLKFPSLCPLYIAEQAGLGRGSEKGYIHGED